MRKIILGALLATISLGAWAGEKDQAGGSAWNRFLHGYRYYAHVGYHIGGTAPIEMPASIRTLHSYRLRPNFVLGVDAYHAISGRWGFVGGLHFEEKAMRTDAGVKGYHMRIVRGGEELEGVFFGQRGDEGGHEPDHRAAADRLRPQSTRAPEGGSLRELRHLAEV